MDTLRCFRMHYYPDLELNQEVRQISMPAWSYGRYNASKFNVLTSYISSLILASERASELIVEYFTESNLFETPKVYRYATHSLHNMYSTTKNEYTFFTQYPTKYNYVEKIELNLSANSEYKPMMRLQDNKYIFTKYTKTQSNQYIIPLEFNKVKDSISKPIDQLVDLTSNITVTVANELQLFTSNSNLKIMSVSLDNTAISDWSDLFIYKTNEMYIPVFDHDMDGIVTLADVNHYQTFIGETIDQIGDPIIYGALDFDSDGVFSSDDYDILVQYVGTVRVPGWYFKPADVGDYEIIYREDYYDFILDSYGIVNSNNLSDIVKIIKSPYANLTFKLQDNSIYAYNALSDYVMDVSIIVKAAYDYVTIVDFDIADDLIVALCYTDTDQLIVTAFNYVNFDFKYTVEINNITYDPNNIELSIFVLPDEHILIYDGTGFYKYEPYYNEYYQPLGSDYMYSLSPIQDSVDSSVNYVIDKVWTTIDYLTYIYGLERYAIESLPNYLNRIKSFLRLPENDYINLINLKFRMELNYNDPIMFLYVPTTITDASDFILTIGLLEINNFVLVDDKLYVDSNLAGKISDNLIVLYNVYSEYFETDTYELVTFKSQRYSILQTETILFKPQHYEPNTDIHLQTFDLSEFKGKFYDEIVSDIYKSNQTYDDIKEYQSKFDSYAYMQIGKNIISTNWR